jgi:phosphatidate cytidylyltransferase
MLKTRVMTAILLLPLLLWLIIKGPQWSLFCVVLVALFVSVFEMAMMIQPRLDQMLRNYARFEADVLNSKSGQAIEPPYNPSTRSSHYIILAVFCALVMAIIFSASVYFGHAAGRGVLVLGLVLAMMAAVFATRGIEAEMARLLGFIITLIYAGLPWMIVWDLYVKEPGGRQLLLVFVVVWMGDTGGYFGGRFLGKTKLAPNKSPKKTWEGASAGLTASVAGSLVYFYWYYPELPGGITGAILVGIFGGISGQMGDLVESVIKRFTRVKDSGNLLPGHGGLLDRMDAVLFAAPVIWFILSWPELRF